MYNMSDFIENQVQSLLAGQALENDDTRNVHALASDAAGMSIDHWLQYILVKLRILFSLIQPM